MFIELIDCLRCTADHRYIALVASISRRDERQVVEGLLGCPTCRREYPIRNGVAWFGTSPESESQELESPGTGAESGPDQAMRVGAFLNVTEGATIALVGAWAACATDLAELVALRVFAINPTVAITESDRVATVRSDKVLPFRGVSLRGIAIDESGWSDDQIEAASRSLATAGRMLAPVSSRIPSGIDEIARDGSWWIGEKRGPLVALHRR
ncbi:MAG: Trm112 family protein [Gemmatimonadaceae bacterium]